MICGQGAAFYSDGAAEVFQQCGIGCRDRIQENSVNTRGRFCVLCRFVPGPVVGGGVSVTVEVNEAVSQQEGGYSGRGDVIWEVLARLSVHGGVRCCVEVSQYYAGYFC